MENVRGMTTPDPVGALISRFAEVRPHERREIRFGEDAWKWAKRAGWPSQPADTDCDAYWRSTDGTLFGIPALLDETLAANAVEVRNAAGETVQLILLGGL
jgi:hypothetical protein